MTVILDLGNGLIQLSMLHLYCSILHLKYLKSFMYHLIQKILTLVEIDFWCYLDIIRTIIIYLLDLTAIEAFLNTIFRSLILDDKVFKWKSENCLGFYTKH